MRKALEDQDFENIKSYLLEGCLLYTSDAADEL